MVLVAPHPVMRRIQPVFGVPVLSGSGAMSVMAVASRASATSSRGACCTAVIAIT
jgi:hypothetical protein